MLNTPELAPRSSASKAIPSLSISPRSTSLPASTPIEPVNVAGSATILSAGAASSTRPRRPRRPSTPRPACRARARARPRARGFRRDRQAAGAVDTEQDRPHASAATRRLKARTIGRAAKSLPRRGAPGGAAAAGDQAGAVDQRDAGAARMRPTSRGLEIVRKGNIVLAPPPARGSAPRLIAWSR